MAISNKNKRIFDWWETDYLVQLFDGRDFAASEWSDRYYVQKQLYSRKIILANDVVFSQLLKELYGKHETKTNR